MPRAFKSRWDKSWYNFYDLTKQTSAKDLTAEYKRMRKEAERRLGALSRSKNETAQTMYRQYKDILGKAPRNKTQTAKSLIAMEKFLSTKTSKVTEIYSAQRKMIDTLQEHGYEFITNRNVKDFGRFMEAMRAAGYARKGSSSTVMDFLSERGKIGKNTEKLKVEFERWLENA